MRHKISNFREWLAWKILLRIQQAIMVVCSLAAIFILVAEVVLRYFFRGDLYGYEDLIVIAAMWMYFIGASYAMYQKSHISADMVGLWLRGRARRIVAWIASAIATGIAIAFAVWAYQFVVWALARRGLTTGLKIPLLLSQSALFFGYVLLAFYAVVYLIEDTVLLVSGRETRA